ncbi:MAG: hypothetical protein KatS3mg012_0559 [Gaiellaceae bacterium]|jgi:hypothetical protein|nr:MAG: hypothetical protein KatS3mg012_0559 [Gaiellaceae bacterium]
MYVLRIEHRVPDFEAWKRAFDSDPVGRERGGVRRHRVLRPADGSLHALIDLEFERAEEAESFLEALRELWGRVDVVRDPHAQVLEVVETAAY